MVDMVDMIRAMARPVHVSVHLVFSTRWSSVHML